MAHHQSDSLEPVPEAAPLQPLGAEKYMRLLHSLHQSGIALSSAHDPKQIFIRQLGNRVRQVDAQWLKAARLVLRSARSPLVGKSMKFGARIHLLGRWWTQPVAAARSLSEFAVQACEDMRLLVQAYNSSALGESQGPIRIILSEGNVNFISSRTRAEIESLAYSDPQGHECPICLEVISRPVAPSCGHAVCSMCYARLSMTSEKSPRCPICREPAPNARPMPTLHAAVMAVAAGA